MISGIYILITAYYSLNVIKLSPKLPIVGAVFNRTGGGRPRDRAVKNRTGGGRPRDRAVKNRTYKSLP